ncbi:hypothetical protein DYBT9275_02971 [Dyadobacter sp. CECT 9275]|uniref:Uncharacterized protein n=1 Tax=Dyadobacter helix TaxID=2822344 RepID=A0A916JBT2_9BACT|nr:hypothetical protein [Dyadobacter sp. CECT 9275]CAG5002816.1 hypothetical protein DYBT9275_02971 [Dyadobacter sp. CECT 9275]
MKRIFTLLLSSLLVTVHVSAQTNAYIDTPFVQDYSIKYYLPDSTSRLFSAVRDRNGVVSVLSAGGMLRPDGGKFQYPGSLQPDKSYKPVVDKKLKAISLFRNELVYLDSKAIFSNAFAGKWLARHEMPDAQCFSVGKDFTAMVSDGKRIKLFGLNELLWEGKYENDDLKDIKFDPVHNRFLLLGQHSVQAFSIPEKQLKTVFESSGLTCFDVSGDKIYIGTKKGYLVLEAGTFKVATPLRDKLPVTDITTIAVAHGNVWFGSALGAFMLRKDGVFNYYYGERWLPGNNVIHISEGEGKQVLVLTDKGLGEIHFDPMTLEEKALVYEKQVRMRHIRYGFNCDVSTLKHGDLSTFEMGQRDSDNLWTSMYLVSQLFRYKATGSKEALQNCLDSFEAMERLFEITDMKGYFARGFERRGYHRFSDKPWDGGMHNGWVHAKDEEWDWRGTTSSDQTVGQMFTLTLMAELMDGEVKQRAIKHIDELMTNIIKNDWYLIDFDGKPTLWGKWHPDYVNGFPKNVGDRKLNSSNIIGFLQTAYHFTGKEIYKQKAFELIEKHGYMENLLRPMAEIGKAQPGADDWAKMLSEGWNHSDDEMYFLAYWCLYPYAFDKNLKAKYKTAIQQHWELERPERDGLWNLCYAMTGAKEFDLAETVWYLKEFPLDMIEWQVRNSHRKDIEFTEPNFRGQTTKTVLPPDERPELKHNRNLFKLDRETNGISELSAGDSFLLPYWMGRYLGVISGPKK